ncbi:MAG: hypothetical protein LBQ28_05085 [Prevotellaceae bacterium]|nr:hypothetical protein [Prevotellaceae bacterium]
MKNIFTLLMIFVFSSCATIYNQRQYPLKITADKPDTRISYNDKEYSLPAIIPVIRSKSDLNIRVINDSIEKDIIIKSRLDGNFVFGNLFWFPFGHLLDLTTSKRFTYGKDILIKPLESNTTYFVPKVYKSKKGDFNLILSLPLVNLFCFQPQYERTQSSAGMFGIAGGFEYFYKDKKSFQLRADVAISFRLYAEQIGGTVSPRTFASSCYLSFTDNWKSGRFILGYGIKYAVNAWSYYGSWYYDRDDDTDYLIDNKPSRHTKNYSLGFTFNAYYQISKKLHIGIIYSPSVFRISPKSGFLYEHVFSFDLAWKINLFRKK